MGACSKYRLGGDVYERLAHMGVVSQPLNYIINVI